MSAPTPIHTQASSHPLPLYAQSQPHETQSSQVQSLLSDAASPSQPQPSQVSSAFAAAQSLAANAPNPVPYIEPPPYVVPGPQKDIPAPTGRLGDGRIRVMTDEEMAKLKPDEIKELRKRGTSLVMEDKVRSMSVADLKKRGFTRVPSGELPFLLSSRLFCAGGNSGEGKRS